MQLTKSYSKLIYENITINNYFLQETEYSMMGMENGRELVMMEDLNEIRTNEQV